MKEYSLLIDNQIVGPLPQDEIEAKIKSGELSPETLIAEAGAAEWTPAKELVSVRSVRLSRKSAEEERRLREAKEEKLDPILRKKLMRYNLADAISVDKFSPEQALAAVTIYEKNLRKGKHIKIGVGIGGFLVTFGAVFMLLSEVRLSGANRSPLAPIMEAFIEPKPEYQKLIKDTAKDVAAAEEMRASIMALEFKMPRGTNPHNDFRSRVVILPEEANFVTGTVNPSGLFSQVLADPNAKPLPEILVFKTKNRPSSSIKKIIEKQITMLALLKTPLWSDEELQAHVNEKLLPDLPIRAEVIPSKNFEAMLKRIKCDTFEKEPESWLMRVESILKTQDSQAKYHLPIERERLKTRKPSRELENRLNSAKTKKAIEDLPKDSPTKVATVAWCVREMPAFLDKLQAFVDENKLYYSQTARQKAWDELIAENGEALEKEFGEDSKKTFPLGGGYTYNVPGRDDTRLCFLVKNDKFTLYVPEMDFRNAAGDLIKPIVLENKRKVTVRAEDVLMDEKYAVSKKLTAGNEPFCATTKILKRKINIIRNSPEVYFIEVTRVCDEPEAQIPEISRRPVLLRVPDKESFDKLNIGTQLPLETLLKYERFVQPKAPTPPSKLTALPKEEIVKPNTKIDEKPLKEAEIEKK